MQITLRTAVPEDYEFSFEAKRQALGPHIAVRWDWNEDFQDEMHRKRWSERPWSIIQNEEQSIGTLSVEEKEDHIRFGEFYLFPEHQRQGIGSRVLRLVLDKADTLRLPVRLEYLKWNPVATLYLRNGFGVVSQNDIHFFLTREPNAS
ncbi:MAG: GNAT family N-acetyltransferase [Rhodoferax sp.]|nr:GNAT family N-acetyltransferase [Rhodoferax sp.]